MNAIKKLMIIPLVILFSIQSIRAQEGGINFVEGKSWQEILAQSEKENKLIFLDCFTTWCGPCKAMSKDVFPLKEVGDFMNPNFINVALDMEKGEGIDLNKKYKEYIPGYPTYLLINSKGEVVHQVAGYNAADKFIAKINDGLESRSWILYSAKYNAGERDWDFVQKYLQTLEDAFQGDLVKKVTAEALPKLNLQIITDNDAAYKIFRKYWKTTDGDLLQSVLSSPALYRSKKDNERDLNDWASRIYKNKVDEFIKSSITPEKFNKTEANAIIGELRRLSVTSRENLIALMLLSQAVADKDGDKFLRIHNSAIELGHLRYNSRDLGECAVYLAGLTSDKAKLERYLECAKMTEKESQRGPAEIRNYAFIIDKLGEKAKAKEYYKQADKVEAEIRAKFENFGN